MDALHGLERRAFDHVDGAPASDMLCHLADALGRTQIALTAARGTAGPVILEEGAYVNADLLDVAREHYATPETNPLFEALPRFQPDRLFHFSTYTTWDAVLSTPFYADFWAPSGIWHAGNYLARFAPDWGLCFAFGARCGHDWYTDEEARLAVEGARTATRAMRLRTEIEDARRLATIDGDPARLVMLVDRAGTILQAPDGASVALRELRLASRHDPPSLAPRSVPVRRLMESAIASALAGEGGRFVLTVPHRMIVEVRPGPSYRHRRSALVLIDRSPGPDWTTDMLTAAYGLTPREADVTRRLCAGRSTDGIAADLGLTVGSVRLYLKRAMPKVGVNSQAQLVAQVLGG